MRIFILLSLILGFLTALAFFHLQRKPIAQDDIARCIIHALAMKGPLNISAVTRQVASMRGRASRRIVRERIKRLRDQGVLLRTDGKTSTYDLVNKAEEQKRL